MIEHLNKIPADPSRVVLIGGNGFIGRSIAQRLSASGINYVAIGRDANDLESSTAATWLRDYCRSGDSIVMIAAKAPAKTSTLLHRNILMAENVCAAFTGKTLHHFLYLSSDAVYADDARPVCERSPCAPSTLHGVMHLAREVMFKSAVSAPIAFLRPTLIYGKQDPHNGYGPNRFMREAKAGGPIHYFGDGEEKRDHIDVNDVALLTTLLLKHRSIGVLNAATGNATRFRDIAAMIGRIAGVPTVSIPRSAPRPHLLHRFFDASETQSAFPRFRYTPLSIGLQFLLD